MRPLLLVVYSLVDFCENMILSDLKNGLSGIMRVKNEAMMIEECIDSCIDALDELIVVCNDCSDSTPEILERKKLQYPEKIKVYYYNHNVLSFDLTEEEYRYALSLPDDSLRLYCNQCNYGLGNVTHKFAVKIDTDQIYFKSELKHWRDICCGERKSFRASYIAGWFFMMYITLYRRLSAALKTPCLFLLPDFLVKWFAPSYRQYAEYCLQRGKASIALSGVNVFKDDGWFVTFDNYNIHPPYNGEGDTVIFKVSDQTFFTRTSSGRGSFSVTEKFNQPYKMMFAGPIWFHQHANRPRCWEKVHQLKRMDPNSFVPLEQFVRMKYSQVCKKMDPGATTLYQRILFAVVHKIGLNAVIENEHLLSNR